METSIIQQIEKEAIPQLVFPTSVQTGSTALSSELEQATTLGNLYHNKVKIFFQALQGSFVVETTIWASTSAYICLKGGITLPVKAISALQLI